MASLRLTSALLTIAPAHSQALGDVAIYARATAQVDATTLDGKVLLG